jgi:hypothetical protein
MTASDMSQISPPLRILIIGSVVFLAAWFVFLKPGGQTATPAATAPVATATTVPAKDTSATTSSSAGAAVQKAEAAKQASEASSAASAGESTPSTTASSTGGAAATTTTPAAKPTPAGSPDKSAATAKATALPLPVAKAVAAKKVLVLLFWNPKASDDRAVRNAVEGLPRHKGKVVVQIADVNQIARYAPITRGVEVTQSPSVVVVDRELKGNLLVGYNDRQTIDQAVQDALAAK